MRSPAGFPSRRDAAAGTVLSLLAASCAMRPSNSIGQESARTSVVIDHEVAERRGFRAAGLESIGDLFGQMLREGLHPGAQLAIYRSGELVAEIMGGTTGPSGTPVSPTTLYQIRSTTKALTVLVMMQAYERGRFRIEDPVALHWPEFAARGKDTITIGHVLSHQAGIPDGPLIPPEQLGDRAAVARAVEAMTPIWPPGTANGYHAATIGWICDELLRRWEGASVAQLLQRDIVEPLGVRDLYIGLPSAEFPRMAPMIVDESVRTGQSLRARFSDFLNTRQGISLPLAWASGVSNARALGRVMCIAAQRGTVDGRRYYEAQTQTLFSAPTNPAGRVDLRLQSPIRWGLGFILGDTPNMYGSAARPSAIGHAGGGANVIWGDPESELAVAFLCNRMLNRESSTRYRRLGDAIYASFS